MQPLSKAAQIRFITEFLQKQVTGEPLRPTTQAYLNAGLLGIDGIHVRDYDTFVKTSDARASSPQTEPVQAQLLHAAERRPRKAFHAAKDFHDGREWVELSDTEFHELIAGLNLRILEATKGKTSLTDTLAIHDLNDRTTYVGTFFKRIAAAVVESGAPIAAEQAALEAIDGPAYYDQAAVSQAMRAYYDQHLESIAAARVLIDAPPGSELNAEDYTRIEFLARGKIWLEHLQSADPDTHAEVQGHQEAAGKMHLAKQIWSRLQTRAGQTGTLPAEVAALQMQRAGELINALPDPMIETLMAGEIPFRHNLAPIVSQEAIAIAQTGEPAQMFMGEFKHPQGIGLVTEGIPFVRAQLEAMGEEYPANDFAQKGAESAEITLVHEAGHGIHLWDFANHKARSDSDLATRIPVEPIRELSERLEKILADDPELKAQFAEQLGGDEERWRRLQEVAAQCLNMLNLDSPYYKANYDDIMIPLEAVGDYFAIKHVLFKDDPALLKFAGPQMDAFHDGLLGDAANQRATLAERSAKQVIAPPEVQAALWDANLPQKFSAAGADAAQREKTR